MLQLLPSTCTTCTNGYKIKMRPVVVMCILVSFVQNFIWNGPGACSWFNNRRTASNFIKVEIEICSSNLKLKYREMKSFLTVICCFLGEVIGWKHFENFERYCIKEWVSINLTTDLVFLRSPNISARFWKGILSLRDVLRRVNTSVNT